MAKSEGEEAFAQAFQFKQFVPKEDHEELRDFLYKLAHNWSEAQSYLKILKQVDEIDYNQKHELLFRIQGMALQCFPLAMRRMTDRSSKRSLRKLIMKIVGMSSRLVKLIVLKRYIRITNFTSIKA